jgi:hypothetical protein
MIQIGLRVSTILILLFLSSRIAHSNELKIVTLRTPPPNPQGYYLSEILQAAYEKIGYKVQFIELPGTREISFANEDKIAAVLARDIEFEINNPKMVRVDVPILNYQVLLVGNRTLCGYCLPEFIDEVGFPRGGQVSPPILNKYFEKAKQLPLFVSESIEDMVTLGRIPAMLSTTIRIPDGLEDEPDIIIHPLETRNDYHYLAPKHAHLKPQLEKALLSMLETGVIAKLKKTYRIDDFLPITMSNSINSALAVTGHWQDYTEKDGSGVYYQIVDEAFKDSIHINKQSSTWERAVRIFEAGKADILIGAYKGLRSGFLTSTFHIDYESEVMIVGKNKLALANAMAGKASANACASAAYELVDEKISKDITLYRSDFFTCERMFKMGRVNVLIDYPYNLADLQKDYPSEVIFDSLPIFLLFHNNERGQYLKWVFDNGIKKAYREDRLKPQFLSEEDFLKAKFK